jgi:two-component sensor histidine kinase
MILSEPILHSVHPDAQLDLLREADHRIANQLTVAVELLRGQLGTVRRGPEFVPREAVCDILQDAVAKVAGIAHLHRVLAHAQADDVDLGSLLISVIREVISALAQRERLRVTQRLSTGCIVSKDRAQSLSLIVVEILMNAIKHARPKEIPIELHVACMRAASGGIVLELSDDGVGLPPGFDIGRDGGVGFRLIRTLANDIGATLQVESDHLGLSFRLQLAEDLAVAAG